MRALQEILGDHPAVMLYFQSDDCGVCQAMRPKVTALLQDCFPKVRLVILRAAEQVSLAGQLRMLSLPGIVFYLDGKEIFRSNGLISMAVLKQQIARPYDLYFT